MQEQDDVINELVIGSFVSAVAALNTIFGTDDIESLAPFSKVLGALRMMNDDAVDELGKPIIISMFDAMGADPKTVEGRKLAEGFVDNIALALQDAVQVMMGQMQQRMAAQQALAAGQGALLKG